MEQNIFDQGIKYDKFYWGRLGNIKEGRGELGEEMPVLVYRLMQFTMLDVLSKDLGIQQASEYFRQAGFLAGVEFSRNVLDLKADFNIFIANLQKNLLDLKIGIMRVEEFDSCTGSIVLTVGQDLDCSGLPITNENVCVYDEGFFAGIFETYTGKKYNVREVDCWASGGRVCRFFGSVTM